MPKREEMIKTLQPIVQGISAVSGVEKIIMFGSFARNTQTITSDVDIAVVYTADDVLRIRNEIAVGMYNWYSGDVDIQTTYIPHEKYLNDMHELNVSYSVRKEGIILWQK
jgi:predicted nucleotidyltransferase